MAPLLTDVACRDDGMKGKGEEEEREGGRRGKGEGEDKVRERGRRGGRGEGRE